MAPPLFHRLTHLFQQKKNMGLVHGTMPFMVWATSERFLPTWATFRPGLASESHWFTTSGGTHRSLATRTS